MRAHYRRQAYADPINWTDYRWDRASRDAPAGRRHEGGARTRRGGLLRAVLVVVGLVFGARLLMGLRRGARGRSGLLTLLLVGLGLYACSRRDGNSNWW
jgi:hypothetical protein